MLNETMGMRLYICKLELNGKCIRSIAKICFGNKSSLGRTRAKNHSDRVNQCRFAGVILADQNIEPRV